MVQKKLEDYNGFQQYFINEFYDDYKDGSLNRRTFIRRLAFMTGSMGATNVLMTALGLEAGDVSADDPMPEPTLYESQTATVAGAQSPYSIAEDDPDVIGNTISFASLGDDISAYFAQPAAEGLYPAVLVCHENRGLNDHIEDIARRFAKSGYVALAIDLLSREGGTAMLDRDQVPGLLGNAGTERHVSDFLAGSAYLQSLNSVDGERLGMTGYCFGGGITWQIAASLPGLKAAVPFYGRGPELEQIPDIKAAILGVYAELDERINAGNAALEEALTNANVTFQFNIYRDVNHAFHNDTGQRYIEEQASQAWNDTLAWFEKYV